MTAAIRPAERTELWRKVEENGRERIAYIEVGQGEVILCSRELFAQMLTELGWTEQERHLGQAKIDADKVPDMHSAGTAKLRYAAEIAGQA